MKIIDQSHELILPEFALSLMRRIELAGRVCYKSEDAITSDSHIKFLEGIINSGHESVIEHGSFSVKFITDRAITHELVRHRLASFSQESQRYCGYNKEKFDGEICYIRPSWFSATSEELNQIIKGEIGTPIYKPESTWLGAMSVGERAYLDLIKDGWKPQFARSVLPNSCKTEIVVTANIREWRHILSLRTSAAAHPMMRSLMKPLLVQLQELMEPLFFDIPVE